MLSSESFGWRAYRQPGLPPFGGKVAFVEQMTDEGFLVLTPGCPLAGRACAPGGTRRGYPAGTEDSALRRPMKYSAPAPGWFAIRRGGVSLDRETTGSAGGGAS